MPDTKSQQSRDDRSCSIGSIGLDTISSYSSNASGGEAMGSTQERTKNTKRKHSSAHLEDADNIEACIESMVARRNELRRRFKDWATNVDETAKKLRCITDNALVNQSTRMEHILETGKTRIDFIRSEQARIHDQLTSFVSMLTSAQSQIFGNLDSICSDKPASVITKNSVLDSVNDL
ncbi:hypothetical protein GGI05_002504 [Coemansia sp. RSA 2603]|nr:hypothetical protein GGI05_002504 [Coemansia sp. RSA 2603]